MADVILKPVSRDDVGPLQKINVSAEQDDFVAPNAVSLAQAAYEPGAYPFVIWAGDIRVGLIQVIDLAENQLRDTHKDPDAIYIWRLLIGIEHQGNGFGRAAIGQIINWARGRKKSAVVLTVVPENAQAIGLYISAGFHPTGHNHSGEDKYILAL